MKTYLIAHINKSGTGGVAQARVEAESEAQAKAIFRKQCPDREVTTVGIEGES